MAKRIGSVDILKALGICSVILYHTEALPTVVNGWIGSYFMPLFFFASGLTFSAKQPKFGAFLKKKCVYLLLPYLLYLVCCAAVGVAKQVIRGVAFPVKSFLLGAVSGLPNMNEYTGRAWFIYCFFVAEILFYFLLKWTKGKRTPLFLAALICLLAEPIVYIACPAAALVCPERPPAALAARPPAVPCVAVGNYAATNPGGGGLELLFALSCRLAYGGGFGCRRGRQAAKIVGRSRVL